MWADSPEGREFISSVTRDLVTQVAPEELDLFEELMGDYYTNPSPPPDDQPSSDDPLAFGLEDMLMATTPAAAAMVTATVSYIAKEVFKVAKEESIKSLLSRVQAYFHPKDKANALTTSQLHHIHHAIKGEAIAFGLQPEDADRLARAMVGTLVLAT